MVSLSGVRPPHLPRCDRFAAELDRRGVPLSVLLDPDSVRADAAASSVGWARERAAGGAAVALHGLGEGETSRAASVPRALRAVNGVRRAEESTLPAHEAGLRLVAAVAAFERAGLRSNAFAAPRRQVSGGTVAALQRSGFAVCADVNGVREFASGRVHSARVHALGRTRTDSWWYRRVVSGIGRAVRSADVVQVTVDTTDLESAERVEALLDAVDLALRMDARPTTYRDLASTSGPGNAGTVPHPRNRTNLDPLTR